MSRFHDPRIIVTTRINKLPNMPSYSILTFNYTGYVNPTDLISLRNPVDSGKVLNLRTMGLLAKCTVAAFVYFTYYRRAALNTGGTPTDLVPVRLDSDSPNAVGVPRLYGAAPVITGGAAFGIFPSGSNIGGLANPSNSIGLNNFMGAGSNAIQEFISPVQVLPGEEFVMNYGGINAAGTGTALPGGFTTTPNFCWTENDL